MESNKTHVCPTDKRRFATKAALEQHRRDAHGGNPPSQGGSAPRAPKRARQRRRAAAAPNRNNTGLAAPSSVVANATDTAILSGCDRVAHILEVSKASHGDIIIDEVISPSMFQRLRLVAEAFQRIVYVSLVFEIVPYLPAVSSGGYVSAVVKDPADKGPKNRNSETVLSWVSSQAGAVSTKIWQPTRLATNFPGSYYTSDSVEIRESSPGRLVVALDGTVNQPGSLTVYARWRVRLSQASVEPPDTLEVKYSVAKDLYTRDGHRGLFYKKGADWGEDIKSQITPSPEVGDQFELPYPTAYQDDVMDLKYANYLVCETENDLVMADDDPTKPYEGNSKGTNMIIRKGTLLGKVAKEVKGNVMEPSSQSTRALETGSVEKLIEQQQQLLQLMHQSLQLSMISTRRLRSSSIRSNESFDNVETSEVAQLCEENS